MRTGSALRRGRARRMPPGTGERSRLPVPLLHDLDPAWSTSDQESAAGAVAELEAALRAVGHPVVSLPVRHADLEACLRPFSPDGQVVLNWCEGLPGLPRSEAPVARKLAALGFAYPGSPAGRPFVSGC